MVAWVSPRASVSLLSSDPALQAQGFATPAALRPSVRRVLAAGGRDCSCEPSTA